MFKRRIQAATLVCGLGIAFWTEGGRASEPVELAPVETRASRTDAVWLEVPAAVSVYSGDELAGAQLLALDELLNRAPGVFAQNRYNFSQGVRLSIRGFGARAAFGVRGIRLQVDGVPLTLPDGQTELDGVDLSLVERVEIIRGPASTLYGNAAGGVIALETAEVPADPMLGVDLASGELGYEAQRLRVGGRAGDWGALGAWGRVRSDGPREHGSAKVDSFSGKLAWPGEAGELHIGVNAIDNRSQDPGGLTAAELAADRSQAAPRNLLFDAGETIEQQRLWLVWDGRLGTRSDYRLWSYGGQREFANRLPFEDGGQSAFERDFGGLGAQLSVERRWLGLVQRWTAGLDLDAQRDDRRRYDNHEGVRGAETLHQREKAESGGAFLVGRLALSPRLALSLGARHDRLELSVDDRHLADGDDSGTRRFDETSLSAGLGWRLAPAHRLFVHYSDSFESPTIGELANPNGGGFNPELGAAKADNLELGLKGRTRALRYELTAFRIDLDDELVSYELEGQSGRSFYRNAGASSRDGAELALDWQATAALRARLAYSYARHRFDEYVTDGADYSGHTIPGLPRQTLFAELAYTHDIWTVRGNVLAYDERYADDANTVREGGVLIGNLRLTAVLPTDDVRIEPYLGIDNLFDRDSLDNLRINAAAGRYYEPGAGRTVYGGLRLVFG